MDTVELTFGQKMDENLMAQRAKAAHESFLTRLQELGEDVDTVEAALAVAVATAREAMNTAGGLIGDTVVALGGLKLAGLALPANDVNRWGIVARYLMGSHLRRLAGQVGAPFLVTVSNRPGGFVAGTSDSELFENLSDAQAGIRPEAGILYTFTAHSKELVVEAMGQVVVETPGDPRSRLTLEVLADDNDKPFLHKVALVADYMDTPPMWWHEYTKEMERVTERWNNDPPLGLRYLAELCVDIGEEPTPTTIMKLADHLLKATAYEAGEVDVPDGRMKA